MVAFQYLFTLSTFGALAFAAPSKLERRQVEPKGAVDCVYVFKCQSDYDGINLKDEVNFLVVSEVLQETNAAMYNYGLTPDINPDDSVSASGKIASYDLEADDLKALVVAWPGKTLTGTGGNGFLKWDVESVTCQ
ncbi:hypothetical protein L218DRAFT_990157 [Marasmius fiardii PR-910]|nr:hypothetical protein L218DRAFT_990157 [Marasmius fiardii PR-910]